jgi:predicted pyridoxine 5'-phosphate oxidase superfamily flavin-nucleotide-binding protein
MSKIYGETRRAFQDQFDTRRIADTVEGGFFADEIGEADQAFIESRDMFWLSTVDENGMPTVSYKGGDVGFVKVVDNKTIAFPSYNGNGMFYSMGTFPGAGKVGMLFMDFEKPIRLRIQGTATVSADDPLMDTYKEAQLIARVTVDFMYPNCPRYVHRMDKVGPSRYVPRENVDTPLAGWKWIDILQDALPAEDKGRADKEGGQITVEDWFGKVAAGNPEA